MKEYNFATFIKLWIPMTAAVIVAIFSAQAWTSQQYFDVSSAAALEHRVTAIEVALDKISDQNDKIIEKLGFISGKMSNGQN